MRTHVRTQKRESGIKKRIRESNTDSCKKHKTCFQNSAVMIATQSKSSSDQQSKLVGFKSCLQIQHSVLLTAMRSAFSQNRKLLLNSKLCMRRGVSIFVLECFSFLLIVQKRRVARSGLDGEPPTRKPSWMVTSNSGPRAGWCLSWPSFLVKLALLWNFTTT